MAVVDNNVLSALAKIDRLSIVPACFDAPGTPTAVLEELRRAEASGYEFVADVRAVTAYRGGWLAVLSPTDDELALAEEVRDHALSSTDAQCIAIADRRDRPIVTDDAHVGTVAGQRGIVVWDFPAVLRAAVRVGAIGSRSEARSVLNDLEERDGYRFRDEDVRWILEAFDG